MNRAWSVGAVSSHRASHQRELRIGHLLVQGHESKMDHPTTMRSIELIGKQVIPALAKR